MNDTLGRPLRDLRISVTDRCNFRCSYCMPLDHYEWVRRSRILRFEEIRRLAAVFAALGVSRLRLTGGEPLVRAEIEDLVAMLAALPDIEDLGLTTNGALLGRLAGPLREAGLHRLNISLDTVREETFRRITRRGDFHDVMSGLMAARDAGFEEVKINAVIRRGVNDEEVLEILDFARENRFQARFIEYMDVGNANHWVSEGLVPGAEILAAIAAEHPLKAAVREDPRAPAAEYRFKDGSGSVGVIASVTAPFCGACSRARLTAEGTLVTCLFAAAGFDLRGLLRGGATDQEIADAIRGVWSRRVDRYSEERCEAMKSETGYDPAGRDKIEMIRLGG
ncbi:MAG: GTP 3',8-cyclase MoaA [bacterium]